MTYWSVLLTYTKRTLNFNTLLDVFSLVVVRSQTYGRVIEAIANFETLSLSSYPQPPNICPEAVIDHVMRTCMLAH